MTDQQREMLIKVALKAMMICSPVASAIRVAAQEACIPATTNDLGDIMVAAHGRTKQ